MKYNEIRENIKSLLPLLKKYNTGSITYQIDQLEIAMEVLDSDILDSEKNKELFRIKKALYPVHGGLTDFNVWVQDGAERATINKPIGDLTDTLWSLLE